MFLYENRIQIASSKKYIGLLGLLLVLLSALGPGCSGEYLGPDESRRSAAGVSTGLFSEWREEAHRHLISVVGTHTVETTVENSKLYLGALFGQERVETMAECMQVAVRFLSEGVASGLNVIAAYVTEILRATGIDVSLPFPHFTSEGVASVTQWALLALIGYCVLSVTLRLVVSVLRRVFWLLKLCTALALFALIVSDTKASTDTTTLRLAALVLACALLGLATSRVRPEETGCLGSRLRDLEGRLKEVEQRKKEV
ncbi:hypothetical protein SKAU_G00031580 [Synaphobranchus kaupii]|uniref:Transmembrane protein 109 n=1 Tax=Synaphobranchus kaupii TaxID=118154 RepID=A0A9Q1JF61_SYNKA|nr:hypothetical protein SKAU_G00031580 [Synaphobranchus kaupii]